MVSIKILSLSLILCQMLPPNSKIQIILGLEKYTSRKKNVGQSFCMCMCDNYNVIFPKEGLKNLTLSGETVEGNKYPIS